MSWKGGGKGGLVAASMKKRSRDKMKPMQSSKKYLFGFHFSGFLELIYLTTVTWL